MGKTICVGPAKISCSANPKRFVRDKYNDATHSPDATDQTHKADASDSTELQ